jgi:hypothetical protein
LKALWAIAYETGKLYQFGPPVALLEQELALAEGVARKLYYNQLTARTRGLARG